MKVLSAHNHAGSPFCSGVLDMSRVERLKKTPRIEFIEAIRKNDPATCLLKTAEIHGHFCPGSALGVMASLYGLGLLGDDGVNSDGIMENLLAIVEVNACFADGVQAVSGCTLGNNALIYRDLGRHAVTFAIRGRGDGVRVRVLPEFKQCIDESVPDFYPLLDKVIIRREGTPGELKLFREKARDAAFALIRLPFETLFAARAIIPDIPAYAPISDTVVCPRCGEPIMASKVLKHGSRKDTCFMCSGGYFEVEGRGIVKKAPRRTLIGANARSYKNG